jgi:hypothetical protein
MKFLDKLYLYIYYCSDKGKGSRLVDLTFSKIFIMPIFGLLSLIISLICSVFHFDIKIAGILILSGIGSFFLSEWIDNKYYTDDKKSKILLQYKKPGVIKYLILVASTFGGVVIGLIGFLFSGIIYHRFIIN